MAQLLKIYFPYEICRRVSS